MNTTDWKDVLGKAFDLPVPEESDNQTAEQHPAAQGLRSAHQASSPSGNVTRIWYHTAPPWTDPEIPSLINPNFA